MTTVRVEVGTRPPCTVDVGPGALALLGESVDGSGVAVVTDRNVQRRVRTPAVAADWPTLAVPPGEGSKSFAVLAEVLDFLAAAGLDRRGVVVALGGGVVGDLAGLAASLYMRGIAVVQCPTTLLAQVDAAVGGKTAINLTAGKNLAGTFHQPRAVLADTTVLATLPDGEFRAGLGEAVKTALLAGEELLGMVEGGAEALLARAPDPLSQLVAGCVRHKAAVVAEDERESGRRKELNLGHTFAHAIELAAGFGRVPHGEAVAVGLTLAARTSARVGLLEDPDLVERIDRILARLGLPAGLAELGEQRDVRLGAEDLVAGMRHDKKGAAGTPSLVLPRAPGRVVIDREVAPEVLLEVIRGAS